MQKVIFKNLRDNRIQEIFKDVLKNYQPLLLNYITVEKIRMRKTTMRAQPHLRSFLGSKKNKKFKVQINKKTELKDKIKLKHLPEEVLFGWFAHELGHIMDYYNRSFLEMIWFGLRYLTSPSFQKKVEHRADEYAIEYGMAHQILETKKFILEHSDISEKYKRRIRKYYMSMDDVQAIVMQNQEDELILKDADVFEL